MKRVGVLGGTFDPIHVGHLIVAESVRVQANLDQVLFVPAGIPPHKDARGLTSGWDRYMMTALAIADHPHFRVSRVDLERSGPSYTVDTLAQLNRELAPVELYFIMGSDSLAQLMTWFRPDRLLIENRVIVATRPGWTLASARDGLGALYEAHADRIQLVEVPGIDVASREIRGRVRQGASIRYLVPDVVLRYIEAHEVYGA